MHKLHENLKVVISAILAGWILLPLTGCGVDKSIPKASILSSGKITILWNEVPGAATYNIYMATSPGVTRLNSYRLPPSAKTTITITDLEPGTTYYFMVSVLDDLGNPIGGSTSKEFSHKVTVTEEIVDFGDLLGKPAKNVKPSVSAGATAASVSADRNDKRDSQNNDADKKRQTEEGGDPGTHIVTIAWDPVDYANAYNIYWHDKEDVSKKNYMKCGHIKRKTQYPLEGLKRNKDYWVVVTSVYVDPKFPVKDGCKFSGIKYSESEESDPLEIRAEQ